MDGKCTVYFEDPYWVGVFERIDDSGFSAARFVFGGEPTEAELHQFMLRDFQSLSFSAPGPIPRTEEWEMGYKRRQRQARAQMRQVGIGTYAQRALKAEHEKMKQVHQEESREEREARERELYLLKQARKKEKHRGH